MYDLLNIFIKKYCCLKYNFCDIPCNKCRFKHYHINRELLILLINIIRKYV